MSAKSMEPNCVVMQIIGERATFFGSFFTGGEGFGVRMVIVLIEKPVLGGRCGDILTPLASGPELGQGMPLAWRPSRQICAPFGKHTLAAIGRLGPSRYQRG